MLAGGADPAPSLREPRLSAQAVVPPLFAASLGYPVIQSRAGGIPGEGPLGSRRSRPGSLALWLFAEELNLFSFVGLVLESRGTSGARRLCDGDVRRRL